MDNLIQKKGESTWYVKLAVPADVQSKLGCKVLIQSLKTGLRSEAMTRRLSVLAGWKSQIETARTGKPLPPDWQDSFAASLEAVDTVTKWSKAAQVGVDIPLAVPVPSRSEMDEFMRANPQLAHSTPSGHPAHQHPATYSTLIRPGSRSAATQVCIVSLKSLPS
uniref:DUF6538 domain-containing protein n=1 Tax=Pseudomonas lactis TaxID=1615674 RepID=UPI002F26DAE0